MTNPGNIVRLRSRAGGHASVYEANMWAQKWPQGLFSGNGVLQNTSPDMNVLVGGTPNGPDVLIAQAPSGFKIALDLVGQQAVPITAPASNSRITSIVAYTNDLSLVSTDAATTGSPSSCGLIVVNGTTASSPVVPTDAQIRAAITADGATGSQATYCVIANIPVASTTTAITDTLIGLMRSLITTAALADDTVTTGKIAAGTYLENGCYLYKDVAQSIATASDTAITFASELFDPLGMHDNSVNTSRITVPATGTYMAIAAIQWGDSTLGDYRIMTFIKNASTSVLSNRSTKDSQGRASNSASVPVALSAGDYMSIRAIHNVGSNLDITAATLSLVRVG